MRKIFSNALFETKERESAVSPVVGVMLMLVVTIIIAATVSAFAGGLVGTSDKAPQAAFEVKMGNDWGTNTLTFTHLGGDPIDTSRTKLVTSWTNRTTKEVYFRETTALPYSETPQEYNVTTGATVKLDLTTVDTKNAKHSYHEPYFVIPGTMPADDPSIWFGNYILHAGDVMKVHGSLSELSYYNADNYKKYSVINNAEWLTGQDVVNVKLIDIPTGQIIYDKDVYPVEA